MSVLFFLVRQIHCFKGSIVSDAILFALLVSAVPVKASLYSDLKFGIIDVRNHCETVLGDMGFAPSKEVAISDHAADVIVVSPRSHFSERLVEDTRYGGLRDIRGFWTQKRGEGLKERSRIACRISGVGGSIAAGYGENLHFGCRSAAAVLERYAETPVARHHALVDDHLLGGHERSLNGGIGLPDGVVRVVKLAPLQSGDTSRDEKTNYSEPLPKYALAVAASAFFAIFFVLTRKGIQKSGGAGAFLVALAFPFFAIGTVLLMTILGV